MGLHALLIMCLTVVAPTWARPVEQEASRHHRFQQQADALTDPPPACRRPKTRGKVCSPGGGVKGYACKKKQ